MRPSRALFSSQTRLLRDFIADSLYNPLHGYFSKQAPVGFLNPPIDFSTLPNRAAYFSEVQRRYTALQVAWLTPVEIFSPHFGASIAHYLTTQHLLNNNNTSSTYSTTTTTTTSNNTVKKKGTDVPLTIYELGGGTGTLARDILNWLKHWRPEIHATCRYTCIEISPTLAELQYQRVVVEQQGVHKDQFRVIRGDASEIATWQEDSSDRQRWQQQKNLEAEEEHCFIVAMEVLDNLPHDKVVYRKGNGGNSSSSQGVWLETHVVGKETRLGNSEKDDVFPTYKEIFQRINDPVIQQCLETWLELESIATEKEETTANKFSLSSFQKNIFQKLIDVASSAAAAASTSHESIFLPTGALQLFNTLHRVRPNHQLLAADFDFLPETVIQGKNAPLVATTVDGVTKDYGSYLIQPGVADIFFPSDFELLARLYNQRCGRSRGSGSGEATHTKSKQFFEKWAVADGKKGIAARKCRDGYYPLLEDYSNTAFLLS